MPVQLNEQLLVAKRGLRMHAKTTAIKLKKRENVTAYFYTLRPLDRDVLDEFQLAENKLQKVPCQIQEVRLEVTCLRLSRLPFSSRRGRTRYSFADPRAND
jgi:hypothetical protein